MLVIPYVIFDNMRRFRIPVSISQSFYFYSLSISLKVSFIFNYNLIEKSFQSIINEKKVIFENNFIGF
jgi:hypothetical protein